MIDKVLKVNDYEAVIYYTHRSPVGLWSSEGRVEELIDIMLCPLDSNAETLSEHTRMVIAASEDTVVINLDDVA